MKHLLLSVIILCFVSCSSDGSQSDPQTVTDFDGNEYNTITIGTQTWTVENLRAVHYRNGDPVPHVTDNTAWSNLNTDAYCDYLNDVTTVDNYGRLYNWWAATDARSLAPAGWHVATDEDWQTLVAYLGGEAVAGGKMKATTDGSWPTPNAGATNESGFTAVATSWRKPNTGDFSTDFTAGWFWSSTPHDDYYYRLNPTLHNYSAEISMNISHPRFGYSVRCVKD